MSAAGRLLASSTTITSNNSEPAAWTGPRHRHRTHAVPGDDTRGTPAWMNASYRKKFKRRHTRSLTSCIGHAPRPHPACGQEKRGPGPKPIVMCNSRLQPSPSRNSTPETLQGSGNCKAAVNNNAVSIPPNYPTSHLHPTSPPTPNSEKPNNITTTRCASEC